MDSKENARRVFEEQMSRIQEVTGKKTQVELAEYLGISKSSVSSAVQRGKLPADWLITLIRTKDVHPEWVLTGLGPCFIRVQAQRVMKQAKLLMIDGEKRKPCAVYLQNLLLMNL